MPDLRDHFGVQAKSTDAVRAGSVGPWDPGGISVIQLANGRKLAHERATPSPRG